MYLNISRSLRSCLLALLAPLFITACGSTDTADSGSTTNSATGYETGDVTLLVTDAPTSDFDEVNVITDSMSLVGEGRSVPLLRKKAKIKLLQLRNSFSRLSKTRVPVGTYSKLRLSVVGVELIKRKPDGSIAEIIIPKLEDKMLDLNTQAQVAVHRGSRHIMKLDVDADKSLHPDQAGNGYIFRTWARCDVEEVPEDPVEDPVVVTPVLMNEKGVARNVLADSFQLCNSADLTDCKQVNVGPNTVYMSNVIEVADNSVVAENTPLQVIGHFDVNTDAINALHVVEDSSRLNSYSGTFSGGVVNDSIDISVTAGTSTGTYPVTPASLPGVYDSDGNVLNVDALGDGVNAEVIGLLNTFPTYQLKPAVVIISNP